MTAHEALAALLANPWVAAYALGCLTGWAAARRATRYMLGGRL
jgi:hypothetical protein